MTPWERMAAEFRKAADIIRREGLAKESFQDMNGAHCAAGAVINAATGEGGHGSYMHRYPLARRHLEALASQLGWGGAERGNALAFVAAWNDAEYRTADDVATALETVANRFEQMAVMAVMAS